MIPRVCVIIPGLTREWNHRWIVDLSVEKTLYTDADAFELTMRNDDDPETYCSVSDQAAKGQSVDIYMGYLSDKGADDWNATNENERWGKDELTHVFSGKIDTVKPSFSGAGTFVHIQGRDWTAPLLDTVFSIAYAERTAAQIATICAKEHGLSTSKITPTNMIITRELYKDRKTWDVLKELAQREGYVCYVDKDKNLVFGPRQNPDTVTAKYAWRPTKEQISSGYVAIEELSFDDSNLDIINKVIVRHWKGNHKTLYEGMAQSVEHIKQYGELKRVFYDSKALSNAIAAEIAQKHLTELMRSVLVLDSLTILGDPALESEQAIEVANAGRFSGTYYIESVSHKYSLNEGFKSTLKSTNIRKEGADGDSDVE